MANSNELVFDGAKRARVEIIPLIDVIFFLLAAFVLFTLSLNRLRSVPVDIPLSTLSDIALENVTIQVSDGDTLYWNTEPTSLGELATRLTVYKSLTTEPRIVIQGDSRAKFGLSAQVLDQIRLAGIQEVSVETRVTAIER